MSSRHSAATLEQIVGDFLMLFVTIDPVGALAIFVALTAGLSPQKRHRVALRAVLCAGIVLLVVLAITLAVLLAANRIHRLIGFSGAAITIRVMGLLLTALAAEQVVAGVQEVVAEIRAT